MSKEDMAMQHSVRNIRQMKRGVEADVTLGVGSVPSASVTMKVVLGPLDPEWRAIQQQLSDLFARKATEHVREVMQYDNLRAKRKMKAGEQATAEVAASSEKTA